MEVNIKEAEIKTADIPNMGCRNLAFNTDTKHFVYKDSDGKIYHFPDNGKFRKAIKASDLEAINNSYKTKVIENNIITGSMNNDTD